MENIPRRLQTVVLKDKSLCRNQKRSLFDSCYNRICAVTLQFVCPATLYVSGQEVNISIKVRMLKTKAIGVTAPNLKKT